MSIEAYSVRKLKILTESSSVVSFPLLNSGQFKKVQSGNIAGRPRGARNKAPLALAALLQEAHQERAITRMTLVLGETPCA